MNILHKLKKIEKVVESEETLIIYSLFLWELKVRKKVENIFKSIIKIFYYILTSFIFINKEVDNNEYDVAFFSFLARDGDFGIVYPVVKKFDDNKKKITYFITKDCFTEKQKELSILKNTKILVLNDRRNKKNLTIKEIFFILKLTLKDYKILSSLDKEIKKNKYFFISLSFCHRITALRMRKEFPNIKKFFSLGDPLVKLIAKEKEHIGIQHGYFYYNAQLNYPWFCHFNIDKGYVFGRKDLEWKELYSKTNLVPMGNPFYDTLSKAERSNISDKLNIYFFSSLQQREHLVKKLFPFFNDILKNLGEQVNLIVKLHPNEDEKIYIEYFKSINKPNIIKGKEKIENLLPNIDIGISIDSTSNLELLVNERVVFQVFFDEWKNEIERQFFSLKINNYKQLNRIVKILKKEKNYKRLLKKEKEILKNNYLKNLGKASQKIYEDIEEIQKEN